MFGIPGLDPGIHVAGPGAKGSNGRAERPCVDARVKPGHDEIIYNSLI